MSSIWGGRTLVVLPQFDPEAWLEAVQNEHVTHSFVVPTMLKRIMEYPDFGKYDLSSLKLITYGAAPMPYEVVSHAVDVFDCGLMNAYGQTESTSTMTYLGPEDHQIPTGAGPRAREEAASPAFGRPRDGRHRRRDHGRRTGRSSTRAHEGEICVQGARIMSEYYKQAEATASADPRRLAAHGRRRLSGR